MSLSFHGVTRIQIEPAAECVASLQSASYRSIVITLEDGTHQTIELFCKSDEAAAIQIL